MARPQIRQGDLVTRILDVARSFIVGAALPLALLVSSQCAQATTFKVLYSFTGGTDGGFPGNGNLIMDSRGNLYGTTTLFANNMVGTVFKLSKEGKETALYTFLGNGEGPNGVIMDKRGNLWGTTFLGGREDCGVIFKVARDGSETEEHDFMGKAKGDGCMSPSSLLLVGDNHFYGVTELGGRGDGTIFEITRRGGRETVLNSLFGRVGLEPFAAPISDSNGNLYGTTLYGGGKASAGTVFRLDPDGSLTILYEFKGGPVDGAYPAGTLLMDASGDLYGTTGGGGQNSGIPCGDNNGFGCGTVFKLAADGTETVLYKFQGGVKNDGANPAAGLIADGAGNFYGTTGLGGSNVSCGGGVGCGTIFKLTTNGTETILHRFVESTDGAVPNAGLVADSSGILYGTTSQGGKDGYGTVFEITP
jgi:uncharacterized repeat protein (TIGR03803 family)